MPSVVASSGFRGHLTSNHHQHHHQHFSSDPHVTLKKLSKKQQQQVMIETTTATPLETFYKPSYYFPQFNNSNNEKHQSSFAYQISAYHSGNGNKKSRNLSSTLNKTSPGSLGCLKIAPKLNSIKTPAGGNTGLASIQSSAQRFPWRVINGDTIRPNTTGVDKVSEVRKYSNVIHQSWRIQMSSAQIKTTEPGMLNHQNWPPLQ